MPDLTDPKTGDPQAGGEKPVRPQTAGGDGTGADGTGADPLARLYRMSATAGRGTQEYVAINHAAVAAFVLGWLSSLTYFHLAFLVVPLAAVFCAAVAFVQITRSNGTQTGRWLAYAGLAIGVVVTGSVVAPRLLARLTQQPDKRVIAGLVTRLGETVGAGDYESAYAMCSDEFRGDVPLADFRDRWEIVQSAPHLGRIESMRWNELVEFEPPTPTGEVTGHAGALLKFQNSAEENRMGIVFIKRGGSWQVHNIPALFPPERQGRGPGGGGPGGGPGGP